MGNNFWPNSNKGKRFRIAVYPREEGVSAKTYVTGVEKDGRGDVLMVHDTRHAEHGLVRESKIAHELAAAIRRRLSGFVVETEVVK